MKRLEVSGAVRPIYGSLGVKRLISTLGFTTDFLHSYNMFSVLVARSSKNVKTGMISLA